MGSTNGPGLIDSGNIRLDQMPAEWASAFTNAAQWFTRLFPLPDQRRLIIWTEDRGNPSIIASHISDWIVCNVHPGRLGFLHAQSPDQAHSEATRAAIHEMAHDWYRCNPRRSEVDHATVEFFSTSDAIFDEAFPNADKLDRSDEPRTDQSGDALWHGSEEAEQLRDRVRSCLKTTGLPAKIVEHAMKNREELVAVALEHAFNVSHEARFFRVVQGAFLAASQADLRTASLREAQFALSYSSEPFENRLTPLAHENRMTLTGLDPRYAHTLQQTLQGLFRARPSVLDGALTISTVEGDNDLSAPFQLGPIDGELTIQFGRHLEPRLSAEYAGYVETMAVLDAVRAFVTLRVHQMQSNGSIDRYDEVLANGLNCSAEALKRELSQVDTHGSMEGKTGMLAAPEMQSRLRNRLGEVAAANVAQDPRSLRLLCMAMDLTDQWPADASLLARVRGFLSPDARVWDQAPITYLQHQRAAPGSPNALLLARQLQASAELSDESAGWRVSMTDWVQRVRLLEHEPIDTRYQRQAERLLAARAMPQLAPDDGVAALLSQV
jgi:hypothetical protein